MKNYGLLFAFSFFAMQFQAQTCTNTPTNVYQTQGDLNNFPSATQNFVGSIVIPGSEACEGGINSLSPLSNLRTISGDLVITRSCDLTSLEPLSNLTSVGGCIKIADLSITSLNGLRNLTTVGGDFQISRCAITSLQGLENLTSIGGSLFISDNLFLNSLTALDHNIAITGGLNIFGNQNVQDCAKIAICNKLTGANIATNATGCNSVDEVTEACASGGCPDAGTVTTITSLPYVNQPLTCHATSLMNTQSFMPEGQTWDGNEAVLKYANSTGQDQVIHVYYTGQHYVALVGVVGCNNLTASGNFANWVYGYANGSRDFSFLLPANQTGFIIIDTRSMDNGTATGVTSPCPGNVSVYAVPFAANNRSAAPLSITPAPTCQNTAVNFRATTLREGFPSSLVCLGTMTNPKLWYTFTATATSHDFKFSNFNITGLNGSTVGSDLKMVVLDGSPVVLPRQEITGSCQLFNVNASTIIETRTVNGLTIGQTYYLALSGESQLNFDLCILVPFIVHWKKESDFPSGRPDRNWSNVNNWVEGRLPTATDSVVIEEDAAYNYTIDLNQNDITIKAVSVNCSRWVRLSGGGFTNINLGDFYEYSASTNDVNGVTLRNIYTINGFFINCDITGNVTSQSSVGFSYSRFQAGATIDNPPSTYTMSFQECVFNTALVLDNPERSFFIGTMTGTGSLTFNNTGKLLTNDFYTPHVLNFNLPVNFEADVTIESVATDWIINFNAATRLNGIITIETETHFNSTLDVPATTRIRGSGQVALMATFVNKSVIAPGSSPGALVINPSVSSTPTAVYEMEIIGGYGDPGIADDADKLESTGNITLDGTLKLILENPEVGSYTIFNSTSGTVSGFGDLDVLYSTDGGATFSPTTPPNTTIQINSNNILVNISGSVLPVELLSFKATPQPPKGELVLLTWQTANEVNNKGFQVERSPQPPQGASLTWEVLGFIPSHPSKGAFRDYEFLDKSPLWGLGAYRLRQIDNDGKETLSKVISVARKGTNKLKVNPNPVSNMLLIETDFDLVRNETNTFQIFNLLGQQVRSGKKPSSGVWGLDVSALPQGTYFLKVGAEQVKFIKQ